MKRIQQNAEIELMKLTYIPWFMGKYFMCHKFEMQHIKSVHNQERSDEEKEKFNLEHFHMHQYKYSRFKSTPWKTSQIMDNKC